MSDSEQNYEEEKPMIIPKQSKDLKACGDCGLLLSTGQWKENNDSCPNQCASQLTRKYTGIACIMKPSKSWVMKNIQPGRDGMLPGMYAIDFSNE